MKKKFKTFFRQVLPAAFALSGMLCNLVPGFAGDGSGTVEIPAGTTVTYIDSNGAPVTISGVTGGSINFGSDNSGSSSSSGAGSTSGSTETSTSAEDYTKKKLEEGMSIGQTYHGPTSASPSVTPPNVILSESLKDDVKNINSGESSNQKEIASLYENNENFLRPPFAIDEKTESEILTTEDVDESQAEIDNADVTVGDPVMITSGRYYNHVTDDSLTAGMNVFNVDRQHLSGEKDQGVFGYAWTSSLDTRIIRGRSKALETLHDKYVEGKKPYEEKIKELTSNSQQAPNYQEVQKYASLIAVYEDKLKEIDSDYQYSLKTQTYNKYSLTEKYSSMDSVGINSILYIDLNGTAILMNYNSTAKVFYPVNAALKDQIKIQYEGNDRSKGFIVTYYNGKVLKYNSYGLPTQIADANGSKINFSYNSNYQLISLSRNGIKTISISYQNDLISKIENILTGKKHFYSYQNGFLQKVENELKDFVYYFYDDNLNVEEIIKSDYTKITIAYEKFLVEKPVESASSSTASSSTASSSTTSAASSSENKTVTEESIRVVSTTDELGNEEKYSWDLENNKLIYTDADEKSIVYFFNDDNKIVREENINRPAKVWTYDKNGNVATYTDGFGTKTYTYNSNGLVTKILYPDGTSNTYIYNSLGLPVKFVNRDNVVTVYNRDAKGNCTSVIRGEKTIAQATYNSWGGLTSYKGIGGEKSYSYDENENLTFDGRKRYTYDSNDRLVEEKDYDNETITYEYFDAERLLVKKYSNGLCEKRYTNFRNQIYKVISTDTETSINYARLNTYDREGKLCNVYLGTGLSEEAALSNLSLTESYGYTKAGRLAYIIKWNAGAAKENDADGWATYYIWEDEELAEVANVFVDYRGVILGKKSGYTLSYFFEDGLFVSKKTDGNGNVSYCYSDEEDRVVKEIDGCGNILNTKYSAAGSLLSEDSGYGAAYNYSWNTALNVIESVSDDEGNILVSNEYDDEGKIIKRCENGALDTSYTYWHNDYELTVTKETALSKDITCADLTGNVSSKILYDENGNACITDKYFYSEHGRKVVIDNDAIRSTKKYDAWGRLISDSKVNEEYTYDIYNRLSTISSRNGKETVSFEYNAMGKVSKETWSNGNVVNYFYSPCGNLTSVKDSLGTVWTAYYDAADQKILEKGRSIPTRKYVYNAAGKVVEYYEGDNLITKIVESENPCQVTEIDGRGNATSVNYNSYGRMLSYTDRLGKSKFYTFDDALGIQTIKDFNEVDVTYTYNLNERKMTYSYPDFGQVISEFNVSGQLVKIKNPAYENTFTYNENHMLEKAFVNNEDDSIEYKYDSNGLLVEKKIGEEKIKYTYNSLGDLLSVKSDSFSSEFAYDDFGREILRKDSDGSTVSKKYDLAGRLILLCHKDNSGKTVFGEASIYGDNGRIAYTVDANSQFTHYEYDDGGRLTEVYYPYSEILENEDKAELLKYGQEINSVKYENISLPSKYKEQMQSLLDEMGASGKLPSSEKIWKRSYVYDGNSNRIEKKSALGSIKYEYDNENRLVKINVNNPVLFEYDDNGNLVKKTDNFTQTLYSYSQTGKMTSAIVTNLEDMTSFSREYEYDGFGRLVLQKDGCGNVLSYLYDGLSNDLVKMYATEKSEVLTSATKAYTDKNLRYVNIKTYTSSKEANGQGEEKERKASGNSYLSLEDGGLYAENRFFVYANGNLIWQKNEGEIYSVCADQRNSLRSVNSTFGGRTYLYDYDVDGNVKLFNKDKSQLYSESDMQQLGLEFAFSNKQYDNLLGFYNFGQRFYDPSNARFATSDPVYDGNNWYSYCAGDPVNFTDPDGLSINDFEITLKMQDYGDQTYGRSTHREEIRQSGCYLVTFFSMLKKFLGEKIKDIKKIAHNNTYFTPLNELRGDKVASDYGLALKSSDFDNRKTRAKSVEREINNLKNDTIGYTVAVKITYPNGGTHFVGTDGKIITDEKTGKQYLHIIQSSINDKPHKTNRSNWYTGEATNSNDKGVYVPLEEVTGLRALYNPACNQEI